MQQNYEGMINANNPNLNCYIHTSLVNDRYMVIGAYVDSGLQEKIKRGKYVDFARLLPKDRNYGDDQHMELINRGGQSFFVPVECESSSGISNISKWEQSFRVYMNVYTKEHPHRAAELMQYNHIIFTAASSYLWDNVYTYDQEFRIHMGNFPNHNWAIILQQAWTMHLKDRIKYDHSKGNSNYGFKKKKEECRHFNKGLCTVGLGCKYDHRCLECGKFGHGTYICRKKLGGGGNGSKGDGNVIAQESISGNQIASASTNNQHNKK